MGGNAFAEILPKESFPRLPPELYRNLKYRLLSLVQGFYTHVEVPCEAPEKEDHGDIDFIVAAPRSGEQYISHLALQEALGATHAILQKENRTSNFAIPLDESNEDLQVVYCQVDVHVCADKDEWEQIRFFHSYGDLGMMLGLLSQTVGLQWGVKGLKYPHPPHPSIMLTESQPASCEFFGLSMARWTSGFATQEEVFEWVASSRFFSPLSFQSSPGKSRKVKSVRVMYHNFVRWSQGRAGSTSIDELAGSLSLDDARVERIREAKKAVFNGRKVSEWLSLGTRWGRVKLIMDATRERHGGDEGLMQVVELEGEEGVRKRVLEVAKDMKE